MSSSGHLIAFAVTPVQAFIREARKAQDVWSSSLLLSHMMLAGLQLFPPEQIVYPVLPADTDGDWARPRVTNEALVHLPDADAGEAARLASAAAEAVRKQWLEFGTRTRSRLTLGLFGDEQLKGWQQQLEAQFEVAWAVAPLGESPVTAVQAIHELLGGAKRARRIVVYTGDVRPKCTLCGQWEQMGPVPERDHKAMDRASAFWQKDFRRQLRGVRDRPLHWAVVARVEADGRERLCAVSLVKRLAPVLEIARRFDVENPGEDPGFAGRFPSTASVAWIDQKERLLQAARARPTQFQQPLIRFNAAVESFCKTHGVPRGLHRLGCHEELLRDLPAELRDCGPRFLQLDGDWLGDPDREAEESNRLIGFEEPDEGERRAAQDGLRAAHRALRETLTTAERLRIRLGRTPPAALVRADADQLGKALEGAVSTGGLDRARALSAMLSREALPRAVARLEGECRGRVFFEGGDELVALVPAVHALAAAEAVALAYEEAGHAAGFPDFTCSVAVAVIHARSPLRSAVEELGRLLGSAKDFERVDPITGQERSRQAFGLAVIPGSGQVKRGVAGLVAPRFDGDRPAGGWRLLGDVLIPLADALRLPPDCGLSISPKLYREWVDFYEPALDEAGGEFLAPDLLPRKGDGIALADFRRMARRHLEVGDTRRFREAADREPWLARWAAAFFGPDGPPPGSQAVRDAVVDGLVRRVRSVLGVRTVVRGREQPSAPWQSVRGLLLGVTALGTREAR